MVVVDMLVPVLATKVRMKNETYFSSPKNKRENPPGGQSDEGVRRRERRGRHPEGSPQGQGGQSAAGGGGRNRSSP